MASAGCLFTHSLTSDDPHHSVHQQGSGSSVLSQSHAFSLGKPRVAQWLGAQPWVRILVPLLAYCTLGERICLSEPQFHLQETYNINYLAMFLCGFMSPCV